jgi:P27 family predicted phage terminase small subunit
VARPPKPAELKARAGNPGKRPVQRNAASAAALNALAPDVADADSAPSTLSAAARDVWREEIARIRTAGLAKNTDLAAFAVYCETLARYRKATKVLAKGGYTYETATGYVRPRPEVGIVERAERTILAFQRSLGLTMDSRIAAAHRLAAAGQYRLPGLDPPAAVAASGPADPAPPSDLPRDPVGWLN